MKMLLKSLVVSAALTVGALIVPRFTMADDTGAAAQAPAGKEAIVVGDVIISDSVNDSATREDRGNQLHRMAEALDGQFIDALNGQRKFTVIVGKDLKQITDQWKRGGPGGIYKQDDPNGVQAAQIRPPKYTVTLTIDDFQDVSEALRSEGHDVLATARNVRLSVVAKIYNINSGELKESANIQVHQRKATQESPGIAKSGDIKDDLLLALTQQAAQKASQRVTDVLFPAKIISHIDKSVTINRGDETDITVGQIWDVFALGKEMKDPDTGEVLGQEEVPSGKIRITSVLPKISKGEVIEDQGLDSGQIVRLHADATPPAADKN